MQEKDVTKILPKKKFSEKAGLPFKKNKMQHLGILMNSSQLTAQLDERSRDCWRERSGAIITMYTTIELGIIRK